jgi:hypothetical protein
MISAQLSVIDRRLSTKALHFSYLLQPERELVASLQPS